jgi:glyoxylase-like metal-dependent hydrolase (beta-lactamase superfamily II)
MKLTDNIHLLKIDFEITLSPERKLPRFVNVLIIFGDRIILVDTGVKNSEEKIFEYIKQNGRDSSEISTVVLSHSHPDHIGSASKIKELTGCSILAHENEKDWIQNIDMQNRERPVPGFYTLVDRTVKVDFFPVDWEEIHAAKDITMQIIHSPGHSKGSLNILFKEDRILFTADSIPLKNDIPNYDSFPDLMKSLEAIKANRNFSTMLTSWTPPLTGADDINRLLQEGEEYMMRIDRIVKGTYTGSEPEPLLFCRKTIEKLGLPPFLAMPVSDRAFRSHLL